MKNTFGFALALALAIGGTLAAAAPASAQVVIQGEVTYQQQQQGYGYAQPQTGYGASPYVQTGGGASPQPVRYIHRSQSIAALWVPGIIALGVGWLGGALIATYGWGDCTGSGCPSADWVGFQWIPIVGPWLALGLSDARDWAPLSYVTGILEDVGLLLFVLGLAIRDEWDEPVYAFGDGPDAARLYLSAGPTQGGASATALLRF